MDNTFNKQEIIDWLSDLEDQTVLHAIQSIKNSHSEGDWWNVLSEKAKEGIRRGETDIQAGRIYNSEEFWKEILRRRNNSV